MKKLTKLVPALIFIALILTTTAVVFYGMGYRPEFINGKPGFLGTGILVTTSRPNGASVFVNGHLTTATDNTLNLAPGEYTIRIFKDGYLPWEKKLKVKKEVVTQASALLFPTAPKLENITSIGVKNPVLDPSGTRLAFAVASQSARKNGIYIFDLTVRPILTLQGASTQITDDSVDEFSNSSFSFSPDGGNLVATTSAGTTYLLQTNGFNPSPQDVTLSLQTVNSEWQKEKLDREKSRLNALSKKLKQMVLANFKIIAWSPEDTRILYEASKSADLPLVINPRLPDFDTTPEQRTIEKGKIYVYDIKEDKNYELDLGRAKNLQWFPDSEHLIFVENSKVEAIEYDGGNKTVVYAGPFVDSFAFPWPDGSKIVILTNLGNPDITPNLYTIGLK